MSVLKVLKNYSKQVDGLTNLLKDFRKICLENHLKV